MNTFIHLSTYLNHIKFFKYSDEISADQKQQKKDGDPPPKNSTSVGTSYSPIQDDMINNEKDDMANNNNVSSMSKNTNFPFDLTPKHHIRSPIIEETESGVEAELLRSRGNVLSSSFNG